MTRTSLDVKDAHSRKNKRRRNKKTKTVSKQSARSNNSTTNDDNTSTPNKLLQNDAYNKVTVHKHRRRPV
jgi:hypothetical protein